ncbi:glycosyltransferase family 9 protein [Salinibacterium sp. SYSU T00001]|uniref:glycosyltransferase family 9 protein n=1 Tax=Homoserinimonas sedimenticola TaxID=2986805 RepID=UPI0022366173|nr:glycosyltransferase family 9 protein [Salinibacterium sedimenticola]MCW4385593.1 glycosyltransferase family 9 protein [Salinibacterium sedimenticola]
MTRALVVRLDSAGDVLLAGPAVRAVAAGADEVVMLCGPQGAPAAHLLPGADSVLTWACPWIVDPAPDTTREHLDELELLLARVSPIDVAVILTSFHQSPLPLALLLRLAGVPRIVGASTDFAGSLLDVRLKPGEDLDEDQPEPERALAIAAAGGFTLPAGDDGRLAVDPISDASPLVGEEPYIVVHPGASVPAREWPATHHRDLVALLAEQGHRVVVTGAPAERELTRFVAGEHGLDLGGRTKLPVLADVLRRARVVVTGNTGPAHLAAAVGAPIVSLFSPVVPAVRWAPYRTRVELLGDQGAACAGSRARVCPVPGHPCLSSVTAEDALAACERLMAADAAKPRHPMVEEVAR